MSTSCKPYPGDVTDEEWAFVAPYLSLKSLVAPQRRHDLREVFNALRWLVHIGSPWRYLPNAPALRLPPWPVVYHQTQRWVVERSFAGTARFRRLAKDDERLPETVVGLQTVTFNCLMLHQAAGLLGASP